VNMRNTILTGAVMLWALFAMLCSVAEQQMVGSSGYTTLDAVLLKPNIFGLVTGFGFLDWGSALLNLITLWFNGTVWQGDWLWFYWIICVPVVIGFVFEMFSFMIWATGNLVSGFRGILGFMR